MRRSTALPLLLAVVLGLTTAAAFGGSATAAPPQDGETAEDAARMISEARARATAASEAWTRAQARLDALIEEKLALDAEVLELNRKAAELHDMLARVAVNRYISAGATGLPLLTGSQEPMDRAETVILTAIIHEESAVTMDDYAAVLDELADKTAEAEDNQRDLEDAQSELADKQQLALDEVDRLKLVERDRLNDEAVMQALEAQRQKDAEAEERMRAEKLKADQALIAEEENAGSDGGDEGLGAITMNRASGGSSGGTTGGGGSGGRPVGSGIIYGVNDNWVCPVQGPTGFLDSWGEPRSGGRFHQGVDMISPAGTPIVAVVDGTAIARSNTLGGITVSFWGLDNNRYYYAHLATYGTLGFVPKGTVIGYVGQTGNAIFSVAHLHFEIHPAHGPAVNPYPTVNFYCGKDRTNPPTGGIILPPPTPTGTVPIVPPTTTTTLVPDPAATTPDTAPGSTAPPVTTTTVPATTPPASTPPETTVPASTPEPPSSEAPPTGG